MSMPWDSPSQPQQPYTAPPQPQYQPQQQPYISPSPQPSYVPPPAQSLRPDVPARPAPQHNDLQTMIQNAINEAIVANKDKIQANAQRALVKVVKGEKPSVSHNSGDGGEDNIESSFEGGPVTTRTFIQGIAVDIGFAMMAALATVVGPDFNAFDKEAWTIVGVLMLKTLIQTGMSYMMKLQVK